MFLHYWHHPPSTKYIAPNHLVLVLVYHCSSSPSMHHYAQFILGHVTKVLALCWWQQGSWKKLSYVHMHLPISSSQLSFYSITSISMFLPYKMTLESCSWAKWIGISTIKMYTSLYTINVCLLEGMPISMKSKDLLQVLSYVLMVPPKIMIEKIIILFRYIPQVFF